MALTPSPALARNTSNVVGNGADEGVGVYLRDVGLVRIVLAISATPNSLSASTPTRVPLTSATAVSVSTSGEAFAPVRTPLFWSSVSALPSPSVAVAVHGRLQRCWS